ncbi:MAG: transposase [Cryomorphaceae bacterium]|nr:transposase [Cryomorphaceae bacterium]
MDDRWVKFSWKDYRAKGKRKTMRLSPLEFIRRFSAHILLDISVILTPQYGHIDPPKKL